MIKGILALFTSGIIFNPMVLLGIIIGSLLSAKLDYEQIDGIFKNYHFYLLGLFFAFGYNVFFKKIYVGSGCALNKKIMFWNTIASTLKFAISTIFTVAFWSMLAF